MDFIDIGQGIRPCVAKKLEILTIVHVFGPEIPKYSRISVKFGTAEATSKFHANPHGAKNLKIAC